VSERVAYSPTLYCSFCGKSHHEVRCMVAGPTVFICDECLDVCVGVVAFHGGAVDGDAEYASWGAP